MGKTQKNNEMAFCSRYKWLIIGIISILCSFAFIAFLIALIVLLFNIAKPITPEIIKSIDVSPFTSSNTSYFATYDLFNKHFVLLFTVFGVLISVFGIVIPLVFYFYQQNVFKDKIEEVNGRVKNMNNILASIQKKEHNIQRLKNQISKQYDEIVSIQEKIYLSDRTNREVWGEIHAHLFNINKKCDIGFALIEATKAIFFFFKIQNIKAITIILEELQNLKDNGAPFNPLQEGMLYTVSAKEMEKLLKEEPRAYKQYENIYKILTPWAFDASNL